MIWAVVFLGGLVIGVLAGRWWAVIAPVAFGIWIAAKTGVDEVPRWYLGTVYAFFGVVGALVGVLLRRRGVHKRESSES